MSTRASTSSAHDVPVVDAWVASSHSTADFRGRAMSWRTESTHARLASDSSHVRADDRPANRGNADITRR